MGSCARWCSTQPGAPLQPRGAARPRPGTRPGAAPRARVRRLPHRPAHRRRRAREPEASARPRPPDRRRGAGGGRAVRSGRSRRRAVARLDGRRRAGTASRAREPLRPRALHRLRPRRRLRRARRRRRALLLPAPGRLRGRARPRRSSAPGSSATGRSGSPATASALGLYGFGASAHIVCQVAVAQGRRVFAGTRAGDDETQAFARSLGAVWAGDALAGPPEELDAVIIFAPVGELVPAALRAVRKGGAVVCAGIHMSDIPSFPYELLWGERVAPLGGEPHPRGRRRVPRARPDRAGAAPRSRRSRSPRRTRRSTACAAARSAARPCCCLPSRSGRARRARPSPTWSTWSVVCSIPNSSLRAARSSSRRAPWQSSPRPTSTCAESAGKPDVIVQMWRSCTSTTPGAPASRSPDRARVDPASAPPRAGSTSSRGGSTTSSRARARRSAMLTSGSACEPAGQQDHTAATATPTEPSEVGEHVPERRLDVEVRAARAVEDRRPRRR